MAYPTGYRDPLRTGDLAQGVGCFLCRPPLRCPLCGGAYELHPIGGAVLADAVTEMLSDTEQLTLALLSGTPEGEDGLAQGGRRLELPGREVELLPTRGVGWWRMGGLVVLAILTVGGFLLGLWLLLYLGSIGKDTTSAFAPLDDNGGFYTRSEEVGRITILRHRIDGMGAFGVPVEIYSGPGESRAGPGVVDGRSPWLLLGWFEDGVSTRLQVRAADSGEVLGAVDPGRWCGGEGSDGYACVLLDDRRVARTTVVAPGYFQPVSIIVSSLETGSTLAEHGPFAGLQALLGTESPSHLVLQVADSPTGSAVVDPGAGLPTGEMLDLDLSTGRTTEIGQYAAGWSPLCAHAVRWQANGSPHGMTVVGLQRAGQGPDQQVSLSGLGPADIAPATWSAAEGYEPSGCSADGRFVYLTSLGPDSAGVTRVLVDRISVQDGRRSLVLDTPGPMPGPWTR